MATPWKIKYDCGHEFANPMLANQAEKILNDQKLKSTRVEVKCPFCLLDVEP